MLKIRSVILIVVAVSTLCSAGFAQKSTKQKSTGSPVLIRVGKLSITLDEFERAYRRMNDRDPYKTTVDSLKEFLGIYADYRLKLLEAQELGLQNDPKITAEIDGYRKLLAGPFILDKEITEPAVKILYERRQWELNASHYLASFKTLDPIDTLKAYKRAMAAIERLNNGDDMGTIVLSSKDLDFLHDLNGSIAAERERIAAGRKDTLEWEGSDDKLTARNGGELGYFTGGMTVRPFEDAAYNLKVGEHTRYPVRSRFGYHVIELIERIPRIGGVKVHHILVAMEKGTFDTMAYYRKADSLLQAVKNGAKFEQVAMESSDDKFSAKNGGDMGYINREERRAEKPFDLVAYTMKDGEISGIVRTSFGYHIIRRDGVLPIASYEDEKEKLKKLYKSYYYNDDKAKKFVELRKQFGARVDTASLDILLSRVDQNRTTLDSAWDAKLTAGERHLALISIGGKQWKVGDFVDTLKTQPGYPLGKSSLLDLTNKLIDNEALDLAGKDVATKYPEFEVMMTDYLNGIMLFELENRKVWSKVGPDSAKEVQYYNDHKVRYMWPERIDISEIYVLSDSMANALYKRIKNGENFDTLAKQYTERPGFKDKAGKWGLVQKDENELSKQVFTKLLTPDDVSAPFEFQSGYSIVKLNRRVPNTQKSFEEARQEVASQFQDELSNDLRAAWVAELRKKYSRNIETKLLEEAWNKNRTSTGKM
jgi:peptidyl-prolyl cis-trans isomerase SurA